MREETGEALLLSIDARLSPIRVQIAEAGLGERDHADGEDGAVDPMDDPGGPVREAIWLSRALRARPDEARIAQ